MQPGLLLPLLATLPCAIAAAISKPVYIFPAALRAKASDASNGCVLPKSYQIKSFTAKSNSSISAASPGVLSSYDFTFADPDTQVTTVCHFNSTSASTTPAGLTPRYACENHDVKFIFRDGDSPEKVMTMIQRVCPKTDGIPMYEVSGSVRLSVNCVPATGACTTNATEHTALFNSISLVRDPTLKARHPNLV